MTPQSLREAASRLDEQVLRCEILADDLDRSRLVLAERLHDVMVGHRPDVWASRAAEHSRELIAGQATRPIAVLVADLGNVVVALRRHASAATAEAWRARAEAERLDQVRHLVDSSVFAQAAPGLR